MSSKTFVSDSPANTEIPALNVSIFLRDETDTTNKVLTAEALGISGEDYLTVMEDAFEINAYHQNLQLGDGTTNSVQIPELFRPNSDASQRLLRRVVTNGSEVVKYKLGSYAVNEDAINGPEQPKHIGLNVSHAAKTGVFVFQNANVCYENTNGFNVTLRSSMKSILDKVGYTPEGTVYAYVVVSPVQDNDVLGKVGSNLSDHAIAASIASGDLSAETNKLIISRQRVNVSGTDAENDFTHEIGGTYVVRDVMMGLLVDLYRSKRTTLVAPLIVLHKLPSIEKVKAELINDTTGKFNIDQDDIDLAKHYMVVNRIVLENDSKNLLESFESTEEDVKAYTILRENPGRRLTMAELNGANAYDTEQLSFKHDIAVSECGHEKVKVETLIYFTSLLSRSLVNKTDVLDNVFWYLKDGTAGQFVTVPATLVDASGQQPELEMVSYRKALVSQLVSSVPSSQALFVRNYENAKVPDVWYQSNEKYDAYGMAQIIRNFGYRLKGDGVQFPVYYSEPTSLTYAFPSLNYYGETKYDEISKTFTEDFFGPNWLNLFLRDVGTDSLDTWLDQAKAFVAHAQDKNVVLSTSLKNTATELAGKSDSIGLEPNKYSLLLVTCLHHIVNASADDKFTFQPSKVVGSTVNVMKNRYERIPLTIELSIERLPRNLLLETTSLRLSEVTFVNNTLLRLAILDTVGNPVSMLLPVLLELKTKDVEVTQRREFEILTDYLVDALDRLDKTHLMNCIWYKINEDGKRVVARAQPFSQLYDAQYNVISEATLPVGSDEYAIPKMLYNKMMGTAGDNATVQQLKTSTDAFLKLSDTKDDTTARGELKDFRYHGINENIYAEDPPAVTGGFAMQVVRWIKSGLINKPEDNSIIGNEDLLVQHVRTKAYDTSGNEMIELAADGDNNAIKVFLKRKLVDTIGSTEEYAPLQNLLDHIYSIDKQRFTINEVARKNMTSVTSELGSGVDTLYMLPIIADDTISLLTTVNGKLVDLNEDVGGTTKQANSLASAMELINQRLRNPQNVNPDGDNDRIGSTTLSITGNAVDDKGVIGAPGVYSRCKNLLVAPEVGPFEKAAAEDPNSLTFPAVHAGNTIYESAADVPVYDEKTYNAFRERSWTVRFNLESELDTQTYEQIRVAQFNAENKGGFGPLDLGLFGGDGDDSVVHPVSFQHYTSGQLKDDEVLLGFTVYANENAIDDIVNYISTFEGSGNEISKEISDIHKVNKESGKRTIVFEFGVGGDSQFGNGELLALASSVSNNPDKYMEFALQTGDNKKVMFKASVSKLFNVQKGLYIIVEDVESSEVNDIENQLELAYNNNTINLFNSALMYYGSRINSYFRLARNADEKFIRVGSSGLEQIKFDLYPGKLNDAAVAEGVTQADLDKLAGEYLVDFNDPANTTAPIGLTAVPLLGEDNITINGISFDFDLENGSRANISMLNEYNTTMNGTISIVDPVTNETLSYVHVVFNMAVRNL